MNRTRAIIIILLSLCLTGCNRPEYVAPTITETSVPTTTPTPVHEINLPVPPEESPKPLPPFTRDNPATDLADIVPLFDHIKAQFFAQFDRPGWHGRKAYGVYSKWLHISDPASKAYDKFINIDCINEIRGDPCLMRNFNALVDGIQYTNENENVAKISESTIFQSCDLQLNGENPCRLAVFGGNLYVHDHIDSLLSRNLGPTTRAAWIESHDGRTSLFLRINEDTQGGYKDKTQTVKILTTEILTEFDWNSGDILYEKHTNHYDDGTDGDGFMIDAQTSEGLKLVCYGEEFPPDIQPAYDLAMSLIDNITNNLKNLSWASVIYHREIKKKIIWIRFPSRL